MSSQSKTSIFLAELGIQYKPVDIKIYRKNPNAIRIFYPTKNHP